MMGWIIAWSMQLRLMVVAAAAVLIFFGVTQLRSMPVDVLPEFSRQYVELQTEALGLSAAEVEAMITVPLEADMLNGVPWVDEIHSESLPSLSSIVLYFEPGTDMLTARQMVQERLVAVHALPNVSKPPAMLQPVSSSNRFMSIGLTSDEHSLIDLSVLSRWTIVPRLMGVPGVAQVSIWGQRRRQLQVLVDPEVLASQRITLHQIIQTAGNALWVSPLSFLQASTPGTGGWIETPNQRLGVQHLLPISTPEDLAKVTVEGTTKRLGEVTTVVEDHQPLIGDAIIDEKPSLMLVVEKFPETSTVDVTHAVEDAVAALKLGLPGVEMDTTVFRPATYLELAVDNLSTALLIGAALLVLAFFGALFNWRTALIAFTAVAISALAAASVLYLREATLNAMLIAGLMVALVAVVDDAIIDIQNIARRLREDPDRDESLRAKAIFAAALQMRRPAVYATVILALGVAPVLLLDGMWGAFSKSIVYAYLLALLASIATALTVTPALSYLLLRSASSVAGDSPLLPRLERGYDGILSRATATASTPLLIAVAVVGALMLGGAWAMPKDGQSILPTFLERDVLITVDGAPGTSETAMRRIATRISGDVRSIPGVRSASAHVGRAVMSDTTSDINGGEIWVSISPAADYDATLAAVRRSVRDYPGFDIDVETFLSERLEDETGNNGGLIVRVYGESVPKLRAKAEEVKRAIADVDGVVEAQVEHPAEHPSLEIKTDLERAKRWGLKPGDVRRAAATLLGGIEVGSLFEHQKVFDVVVWGTPEVRHSPSAVEDLLIDTPGGHQVRLREVADTRIAPAPTVIKREAVARYVDVDIDVAGRGLGAVIADINTRIRENVEFPLEYRAEVMGTHAKTLEARSRVRASAIAAAFGILLLMQAAFRSWSLAILIFFSLPVALLGGILTAALFGSLASLGALLGLGAVFAVALRNALTLVSHYRDLERKAGGAFSSELVVRGTRERFVPIVTTAVAAALAFLPFALLGNVAGHEILHPMALTVLGGLVTSTLVNLLVVPMLYLRFGASTEPAALVEEEAA